jgi:hypothetical protein
MMNDDWLPAFAKLTPSQAPEEDDQLQLGPNAMSLEGLQAVYRNPNLPLTTRMRAMIAAIPFETPKLAVTAQVSEQDFATLLDKRIARYEQMKLLADEKIIEAQPEVLTKPQVETKPPLARTPDRRFRRI